MLMEKDSFTWKSKAWLKTLSVSWMSFKPPRKTKSHLKAKGRHWVRGELSSRFIPQHEALICEFLCTLCRRR